MITTIIEEKENFIDNGRMIVWDYETLDRRHSWCLYIVLDKSTMKLNIIWKKIVKDKK